MNPLGGPQSTLPPQVLQNIQQVKQMMNSTQNPMLNEVLQMCKGRNPQEVFMALCKQRGIDPEAVLKELRK